VAGSSVCSGVGVGLGEGGDCDRDEVGAGDDDGPDVTLVGGSVFPLHLYILFTSSMSPSETPWALPMTSCIDES